MAPSPDIPRKRVRRVRNEGTSPDYVLKTPPRAESDWKSELYRLCTNLRASFDDFGKFHGANTEKKSAEMVLNGFNTIRETLTQLTQRVDESCRNIVAQVPDLGDNLALLDKQTQTNITSSTDKESMSFPSANKDSVPTPLPRTYASVSTSHTPQSQVLPSRQPSTQGANPSSAKPQNPVRLVVQAKDSPTLPIRNIPVPEFFRRLAAACSKVPGSPTPLGAQWNRKDNLILSFPAGSTRTAIKLLYPSIRSLLDSAEQPVFRFDVPWTKIHLAGIRARDGPDQPAASKEELRQTLQLNPAIRTLAITVQPTWLKKPSDIAGTHTSAVIAFEDPDGSIERTLLKSKIFAFGESVTIKKWHNRPPAGNLIR